ncbi:MAG TPA: SGNH/GDSL hydrolase family protein [Coleofasciculaceae cyanobacterium]|jgi:lysophospholipase L1-like esterase
MFRTKVRERRIFTKGRQVRRRFSWLSAIASIALFLLVLELLTRIFIDLSGSRSEFAQAQESILEQAYGLNFINPESGEDIKKGELTAKSAISVGYELIGNQQSEYWQINEQGFRDRNTVPLIKPKNEIRIFLLGGSTAFGYGNSSNSTTISAQLEKRLQERLQQQQTSPQLYKSDLLPERVERQKNLAKPAKIKAGNYRVINAGVPGYASGNELAQLALQILKYKPDLIVVLDGYVDLMLDSDQTATQVPLLKQDLAARPNSVGTYLDRFIEPLRNNSYLVKVAENRWLSRQEANSQTDFIFDEQASNLVKHLPTDEAELQSRVDRYIEHQKQMLNLSTAAQVPLLVAIQPEITGRNPSQLTDIEGEIATELGRNYIERVKASYPAFTEASAKLAKFYPKNLEVVDLYQLTEKYPSPSFIDAIHLNEAANEKAAEQLYYAIAGFSKMQAVPQEPIPESAPVLRSNRSQS